MDSTNPQGGPAKTPPTSVAPAAKPKTSNSRFLAIIAAIIVIGGGITAWLALNPSISTDNASVDRDRVTISSKIMAHIVKIFVKEGDEVSKGALLVQLDTSDLEAQKTQAAANVVIAQESAQIAQFNFTRAKSDFERAKDQYRHEIISTQAFEHAQTAFDNAQIDATLALKRITVAEGQLAYVNSLLDSATMTAPFDAVVAKKWLHSGDLLQPGQPVLTLFNSQYAWITANLEETKIGKIKVGDPVEIHIDAYPNQVWHGRVEEIGDSTGNQFSLIPVNNAAGNFTKVTQRIPIKIAVIESTDLTNTKVKPLYPGMSAFVDIKP
jgi:membrane fusion protein (multidrug efflux system)